MMVDIETLGDVPDSAILSIGACIFDEKEVFPQTFYVNVDRYNCLILGLKATDSTVNWWKQQSAEAQAALLDPKPILLREALSGLAVWYNSVGANNVWSHGSSFDLVVLDQAFRRIGKRAPWHFRQFRDTRTLIGLMSETEQIEEWEKAAAKYPLKHHALEDAKRQAQVISSIHGRLGFKIENF